MDQLELSCIAAGNINNTTILNICLATSNKVKQIICSHVSLPIQQKHIHTFVHLKYIQDYTLKP